MLARSYREYREYLIEGGETTQIQNEKSFGNISVSSNPEGKA